MKKLYLGAAFAALLVSAPAMAQGIITNPTAFPSAQLGVAGGATFFNSRSQATVETFVPRVPTGQTGAGSILPGASSSGLANNTVILFGQGTGNVNTAGAGQVTGAAQAGALVGQTTFAGAANGGAAQATATAAGAIGALGGGFIGRR